MKILIIEDQTMDLLGVYELLAHLGHVVHLAFDGQQGLDQIYKGKFDLVILDWNLPLMSGRDIINKIESDHLRKNMKLPVKIILHSGEDLTFEHFQDYSRVELLDVWQKPMRMAVILKRLKEITYDNRRVA